jgi:uncharacterized membrane protein
MATTDKPLTLEELRAQHPPLRNVFQEHQQELSRMDHVALFITSHVGTMGFFLAIAAWTVIWLGWNLLAPKSMQFDPPTAFVFWLFISNMIQILLMPLLMVGQNLQGRHAELRAQNDYEVNVRAESEIQLLMEHIKKIEASLERIAGKPGQ